MDEAGYSNILQNCIENLLLAEKQFQDKNTSFSSHPNLISTLEQFWKEIDLISKKLSYECTKLCLCCTSSPLPTSSEISALLQGIEQAVLALVSVAFRFNSQWGKTLHEILVSSCVAAIQSSRQLIRVVKDDGGNGVDERYRQATGIVWEGCRSLENCPKDNKEAVLTDMKEQKCLVRDAFEEITETLKGDGKDWDSGINSSDNEDEPSGWSEQDKLTMDPSVNIIKAAKVFYQKIVPAIEKNGRCDSEDDNLELDILLQDSKPISQTVDTLILELYPPLNIENMDLQSRTLGSHLMSSLKTATKSHVITEDLQPTMEFILKAVEHNLNKMKDILRNL